MGMFDTVMVPCPKCGRGQGEFQSKAGDCALTTYTLHDAPKAILGDLDRKESKCDRCNYPMQIEVLIHARVK